MKLSEIFRRGQEIARIWPRDIKVINAMYREGLIASMVVYASKWMPPVLCFFIVWYFCFLRFSAVSFPPYLWPSVVFMLMLGFLAPLWGIRALGKRSLRKLNSREIAWYCRICRAAGDIPDSAPDVLLLARALRKALDRAGTNPKPFLDDI